MRHRDVTGGPFLLIGGDSEIAQATAAHLRDEGLGSVATTRRPQAVAPDRPFLDLARPLDDWRPPDGIGAACIFAAVGHLVDCARDPASSSLVNVTQTISLVDRLVADGVPVLFLSTDKVFDGSRSHMPADAPTCPVSEYGRQKAMTERALAARMAAGAPIAILRLAKIVSPGMPLLRQWSRTLASGARVNAFYDMVMAPTPVALVATAVIGLLAEPRRGVFQLSGPKDVSYYEIGQYLARTHGAPPGLVVPVSASSAGMPEGSTPAHTTLDSSRVRDHFGIAVPDPWVVIDELAATCRN